MRHQVISRLEGCSAPQATGPGCPVYALHVMGPVTAAGVLLVRCRAALLDTDIRLKVVEDVFPVRSVISIRQHTLGSAACAGRQKERLTSTQIANQL